MLVSIQHRTELSYDAPISESVLELRMAPRSDARQVLRGFGLAVGPGAQVFEHLDWLGNRVHQFSVVEPHDRVVVLAHAAVETRPEAVALAPLRRAPPDAADHRLTDYLTLEGLVNADPRLGDLAGRLGLGSGLTLGELALRVTHGLRAELTYQKGVTTTAASVSTVLDAGAGVCQDFAHLGLALLRRAGVPARYVSGYLHRPGATEVETHAWCEVWAAEQGWVGLDPTHADTVGEGHIAVAAGRTFADVPPNRGIYRGNARETIRVAVGIEEVREVPRGLLASLPAALEVQTLVHAPPHREQLDYQQEQEQQQQQQ